jgi:hypothetical protein
VIQALLWAALIVLVLGHWYFAIFPPDLSLGPPCTARHPEGYPCSWYEGHKGLHGADTPAGRVTWL